MQGRDCQCAPLWMPPRAPVCPQHVPSKAGAAQRASYRPGRLQGGTQPTLRALTWNAGDAQDVGIADGELVHHGAGLVGIDDDHFAGGQGAGEDPHTAARGVRLGELLRLFPSMGERAGTERRPLRQAQGCGGLLNSLRVQPCPRPQGTSSSQQGSKNSALNFPSRPLACVASLPWRRAGLQCHRPCPPASLGHRTKPFPPASCPQPLALLLRTACEEGDPPGGLSPPALSRPRLPWTGGEDFR